MFCTYCGTEMPENARFCFTCGKASDLPPNVSKGSSEPSAIVPAPVISVSDPGQNDLIYPPTSPNEPLTMALCSGCCIAGMGQMALGQVGKGLVILGGSIVLALMTGGVSAFLTWPLSAVDAFLIAKKLRDGHAVAKWEWF
jgi:TM2 domain-containing membrane protein YozV